MPKKLSRFGYEALERLDKKTNEFCDGKIPLSDIAGVSKAGNTTARIMDSTLRVEKFDTAMAVLSRR